MRLRHLLAALLLTGALAGAGCGEDTEAKNAYVEEVRAAQRLYLTRFDQVLERLTPTSTPGQDRATLGRIEALTVTFARALRAVEVPPEVAAEHRRLVAALSTIGERFTRAQEQLADGDAQNRAAVRTDLAGDVGLAQQRISDAVVGINDALNE